MSDRLSQNDPLVKQDPREPWGVSGKISFYGTFSEMNINEFLSMWMDANPEEVKPPFFEHRFHPPAQHGLSVEGGSVESLSGGFGECDDDDAGDPPPASGPSPKPFARG